MVNDSNYYDSFEMNKNVVDFHLINDRTNLVMLLLLVLVVKVKEAL